MSWYRGDHYEPRPHPHRADAYGRQAYVTPPTAAQHHRDASPRFVDPLESVSRPRGYRERDHGWANRGRHAGSSQISLPPPPQTVDPRRTSDPRARATTPAYGWSPQDTSYVNESQNDEGAPATALEVPDVEYKLEYLLRTIEGRLARDLAVALPRWSFHDTKFISDLIEEHRKVGEQGTMRLRTMRTACTYYGVLLDCRMAERIDHLPIEKVEAIRDGVQNIVFDICEEGRTLTRMEGHRKLLELCSKDITLVQSNVSALVQLLQNDGGGERMLVSEVLADHLTLARQADYPGGSLADCLQVMFDKDPRFQSLVVDFFASPPGQKIVDLMAADHLHAAVLACCLAGMLPIAVESDVTKITKLLYDLQSIWTGPNDVLLLSEAEVSAALGAAVDVLWSLVRVVMDKRRVYVFPTSGDGAAEPLFPTPGLAELLNKFEATTSKDRFLQDGPKVFNSLLEVVERTIHDHDEVKANHRLSEAKVFVNELEAAAQYLFCYFPPNTQGQELKAVEHFSAARRLVLFRSIANLAARVASAAKQAHPALGFPAEQLPSDVAEVAARALKALVPTNRSSSKDSSDDHDKVRAESAYTMLAAEALLTAIHRCESCLNRRAIVSTDTVLREKVRSLSVLAQGVDGSYSGRAAAVVSSLAKELLSQCQRVSGDVESPSPPWLMLPPPFPEWKDPSAGVPTPAPAPAAQPSSSSSKKSRKRRASREEPIDEGRVRGRGAVHFRPQSPDPGWGPPVKAESSMAALTPLDTQTGIAIQGTNTGIAIRGAAEHRSSTDEAGGFRPTIKTEPAHAAPVPLALADRIEERKRSESCSEPSRPRSQERPEEVHVGEISGWGRRRDLDGHGHGRRDRWGR